MDSAFTLRGLVGRRCILLRRAGSGAGTASRAFGRPYFAGGEDLVGCRHALLRGQGLVRLRVGSALMGLVTSRRALLRISEGLG